MSRERGDVERVREATDIVAVISQYVGLKPAGENLTGVCPFHRDNKPSMTVSPAKQLYYCFGCGAGGDVFDFVMRVEGLTFGEVLRKLGARAGIALQTGTRSGPEDRRRERLLAAVAEAERYYYENLRASNAYAAAARDYLTNRGLAEETAERWGLGLAPDGWEGLLTRAAHAGFEAQELAEAGLAVPGKDGGGYHDRFRSRIVFPIANLSGQTVAFGGRILGEGEPKYLNSSNTPLYNKSATPYGLDRHRAQINRAGVCVVVEGYFDLIGMAQAGVENAVATCGTALTEEAAHILSRYAREFVLVYDGDDAGIRAARRAAPVLLKEGVRVRVAVVPPGQDPFDVSLRGPEALAEVLNAATDWFDFLVLLARREHGGDKLSARLAVIKEAGPLLAAIPDELERRFWQRRVADRLGIAPDEFELRVPAAGPKSGAVCAPVPAERNLLQILLQYPPAAPAVLAEVSLEDITDEQVARVFKAIGKLAQRGSFSVIELLDDLDEEEDTRLVTSLAMVPTRDEDCARAARLAVDRLKHQALSRRMRTFREKAEEGLEGLDDDEMRALWDEKRRQIGK